MKPDERTAGPAPAPAGRSGWRELSIVVLGFVVLTVLLTAPLAFHIGTVGRVDNADTRLLIWNVAWVARTLVVDPLHVFDANIFYPHRGTLAYSESNLGAGILAIPVYWATRNPVAAHNFVVLLSFVLSAAGTYYLVRYVVGDRRAAVVAAICFAYCPYVFSHLPHVHLLMTAGLPFSMLAFHRLVDRPTTGRAAALGGTMAAEALLCGYYAVFVGLTVGYAALVVAALRRTWADVRYWRALAIAVAVAAAIALPLYIPYVRLQRATGFSRPLDDARDLAAFWQTYLASSAYAHAWMLRLIGHWTEVLFPGFVALTAGIAGAALASRTPGRLREMAILYGGLLVLAFWASLGPDAGLYRLLHATIPAFTLLRAPSRFGVIVVFALCVMAGVALARLAQRSTVLLAIVAVAAVLELRVPLGFSTVPPADPAYRVLATLPRGAVIEMPFYSTHFASERTRYMLDSTIHWMPLVNAYSSHIPRDLIEHTGVLAGFPSVEAFRVLEQERVRYALFHWNRFDAEARDQVLTRLHQFDRYLQRRYADADVWLFEIVDAPR